MDNPYNQLEDFISNNGGMIEKPLDIDGHWHNLRSANSTNAKNKAFGYVAFQNDDGSIGGQIKNYALSDEPQNFIFREKEKTFDNPKANFEDAKNSLLANFTKSERGQIEFYSLLLERKHGHRITAEEFIQQSKETFPEILNVPSDLWTGDINSSSVRSKDNSSFSIMLPHQETPVATFSTIDEADHFSNKLAAAYALIQPNPEKIRDLDRKIKLEERERRSIEKEAENERKHAEMARKAQYVFRKEHPAQADHPYLVRKKVQPHMAKVNQAGMLIIPLLNEEGRIQTLEFIGPNGFKKMLKGGKSTGVFTPFGFEKDKEPAQIVIAEGFATSASIYEATGLPTVHARGKGNMEKVTDIMMARHPDSKIILSADNDITRDGNVGLKAAEKIKEKHPDVTIVMPDQQGEDFNDLAVKDQGPERIREIFSINKEKKLTEAEALKLMTKGEHQSVLDAVEKGDLALSPAIEHSLLEASNPQIARESMVHALNSQNQGARRIAADLLTKTNDGTPGANYDDISRQDVVKINNDPSPTAKFAAQQTLLDKEGVDLPDNISSIVTDWQNEILKRQKEFGLNDEQVARINSLFAERALANKDKLLHRPHEKVKQQQIQNTQELQNER